MRRGDSEARHRTIGARQRRASVGWHEHDEGVVSGCERFFRPGYAANLVTGWLPALDGVEAKLNARAGLDSQVRFEVASAQTFRSGPYDLVTSFDCLHDMGDPLGAARQIREMLAPDGTWMVVEPYAGNSATENLNPVGRVYYSLSTFLCISHALFEEGGHSLDAQAGEEPILRLAADAGFTRFRRVAETPFNIVYEARP